MNCEVPGGDAKAEQKVVVVSNARFNATGDYLVRHIAFPYITHVQHKDVLEFLGNLSDGHLATLLKPIDQALIADTTPVPPVVPNALTIGAVWSVVVVFAQQDNEKMRRSVCVSNRNYERDYRCLMFAPATSQAHKEQPFDIKYVNPTPASGFDEDVRIRARAISVRRTRLVRAHGALPKRKTREILTHARAAIGL